MKKKDKEMLMASVTSDTLKKVQSKFKSHKLIIKDKDFFDYDLLKAALNREHQAIIIFLLKLGCRVRNPNKINSEETPLHLAVKLGNDIIIKKILLSGASIYDKNENGETPIQAGFKKKYENAVNTILNCFYLKNDAFQDPDPKNEDDILHFHIACIMNNLDVVRRYLEFGFDMNSPLSLDSAELSGLNPLHYAATKKYYNSYKESNLFDCFIEQGADLSIKNRDGLTVLHHFYYSNDSKYMINKIFNHKNETKFINSIDHYGVSHFHLCCMASNAKNVQVFIDKGVDVNSAISLSCSKHPGFTPLHFAVKYGSDEVVQLLLQNGADCNKMDKEGNTPLHLANNSKVKLIFNHGNDTKFINSVNSDGLSHFHLCCTQNYPDLVNVFIDKGVDVNSATFFSCSVQPGFTPLHFAIDHCSDKVVRLLLENSADCNKKAKDGTTPLHLACDHFYSDIEVKLSIIEMLLNYEASVVIVDEKGQTPLHLAFNNIHDYETKAFEMLISKIPRKVNFTDNNGLSHFHIVCTKTDISRVEDFLKSGVAVDSSVALGRFAGYTALHFAVIYNQMHVVEMLLNWKAQVNIKTCQLGVTPLYFACEFSFTKVSKMYNHYVFAKSNNGLVNLDWTLNRTNQLNIIKLLLLNGADVENEDIESATVLLNTCQVGKDFPCFPQQTFYSFIKDSLEGEILFRIKEIIEILLLNKANINAQTKYKNDSIFHVITRNYFLKNSEEFIAFLVSKGANLNVADKNGYTPLHFAIRLKNKKLVQIFLKHKADVNAKNINVKTKNFCKCCDCSLTPLETVCKNFCKHSSLEDKEIICAVLEGASDLDIRDDNGRLLLQDAILNNKIFIIEKLLYYGADINMEDSQGNLSVSDLFMWDRKVIGFQWTSDESYVEIFKIVFIHVQKLLAVGHYVHKKIQQCCIKLRRRYSMVPRTLEENQILNNIYDNCIKELDNMKLVKIDNYTSLRCILVKDPHESSKHVKNETLVKILDDPNIDDNYPLYSYLLKIQFKKGLIRSDALQSANAALSSAIGLNLPDSCCDSILQYLTNEEIADLKIAVPVITSCKRKLTNDCTKMEPSAKLQKKE